MGPAFAADEKAATPAGANPDPQAEQRRQRIEFLARREGYRVVERDGERLYCKDEEITGTRARKQRSCVTEDRIELQIDLESATAREILDKGLRGFTKRDP